MSFDTALLQRLAARSEATMREWHRRNRRGVEERVQPGRGGATWLRLAKVIRSGGGSGSQSTPCTYTYDVWSNSADPTTAAPLATMLTPIRHERTEVGEFVWLPLMGLIWNYATIFSADPQVADGVSIWEVCGERPAVLGCPCP